MRLTSALAIACLGAVPAGAVARAARPAATAPAVRAVALPVAALNAGLAPSAVVRGGLSTMLVAAQDGPRLADTLRAQAAETVAQWRAGREPAAVPVARAAATAVPAPTPAEAIATAATADQALARLAALGVIGAADIPDGEVDRVALLKRVWDGVSASLTSERLPVDASWAVPAITVKRGGKTYLVHGVAHGAFYPPNRGRVTRLVSQIEKRGEALLSEQNLPLHYGYAYGQETADHGIDRYGARASVTDAASRPGVAVSGAAHAVLRLGALGAAGYALARAALQPSEPLLWGFAVAAVLALWLLARGLQPLFRLSALAAARQAERLGSKDLAAHLRREARAFFGPGAVSAEDILRLHLPPGPGAAADSLSPRSAAIAAAAAAVSASVIHVLVGYAHAAEIAWRLAEPEGPASGPSPRAPESQDR